MCTASVAVIGVTSSDQVTTVYALLRLPPLSGLEASDGDLGLDAPIRLVLTPLPASFGVSPDTSAAPSVWPVDGAVNFLHESSRPGDAAGLDPAPSAPRSTGRWGGSTRDSEVEYGERWDWAHDTQRGPVVWS